MAVQDIVSKTWIQNNIFSTKFTKGPIQGKEYCVKSISMPDFTRSAIEEYNNYNWQFAPGRQEMYVISITFVDNEQDKIYSKILKWWEEKSNTYASEQFVDIFIFGTKRKHRQKMIQGVKFQNAIIDSISGLQYDNSSQNQIIEFTVTFKTDKFKVFEADADPKTDNYGYENIGKTNKKIGTFEGYDGDEDDYSLLDSAEDAKHAVYETEKLKSFVERGGIQNEVKWGASRLTGQDFEF